jgi:type IV fimbrial biogenesis protein FimT
MVSMRSCAPHTSAGFTLTELLVVVAVLSIFLALAGPALSSVVATQQVRNASYDLHASLSVARSEALTRNAPVTVEPNDGDWARGWTITVTGGTVLRRQAAYPRIALSGPPRVIYSGDGRPDSTATPFTLSATDASAEAYRCLRLRLNGRSAIDKGAC